MFCVCVFVLFGVLLVSVCWFYFRYLHCYPRNSINTHWIELDWIEDIYIYIYIYIYMCVCVCVCVCVYTRLKNVEHRRENWNTRGKSRSSVTIFTTNPTWITHSLILSLRNAKRDIFCLLQWLTAFLENRYLTFVRSFRIFRFLSLHVTYDADVKYTWRER